MKRQMLLRIGMALLFTGATASADIIVTFTRMDGTGPNAGQDILRFFAAFAADKLPWNARRSWDDGPRGLGRDRTSERQRDHGGAANCSGPERVV